jgi:hypothetical protein
MAQQAREAASPLKGIIYVVLEKIQTSNELEGTQI